MFLVIVSYSCKTSVIQFLTAKLVVNKTIITIIIKSIIYTISAFYPIG
jgi:hypothetical protein